MKLMVGYDGSNSSKEALRVAKKHAKAFNAKVHVVHSMESGTDSQREDITAMTCTK
jgi:nucleotide-binding universal stress UspA family protein